MKIKTGLMMCCLLSRGPHRLGAWRKRAARDRREGSIACGDHSRCQARPLKMWRVLPKVVE
eukprot:2945134-Rhodomonas_salina.1